MLLVEIGTFSVISAYFYRHITSDPIEGQPVQLSDYLFVFGCGLVFWLLVMLRAKLHEVAELAILIAPITTLSLCGCLLAPFMKLPLLVRFLVLFQVSSNLALLLIWAFLSLKEYMILQRDKAEVRLDLLKARRERLSRDVQYVQNLRKESSSKPPLSVSEEEDIQLAERARRDILWIDRQCDEILSIDRQCEDIRSKLWWLRLFLSWVSGSGHGSGAIGREENRGRYGGIDGGGGRSGSGASGSGGGSEGGDRSEDGGGDRGASGSGHGSGAGGSGGGNEGGDRGSEGGGDRGASGSGGGIEGGDRGRDGVDLESGGRGTNKEIIKISIMLTAQTTGTLIGFHSITTPSSTSKVLLVVALMDQLVAYLCGVTGLLLISNKPAAGIFGCIGFVCTTLGYILTIAMYVTPYLPWYSVLIVVLLFGVFWLFYFWNTLKTGATEVWNYLKNSTQSIKNCIETLFESGS